MRLPDNWRKAPLTAGLAILTVAAWLVVALFQLEDAAAETLGFWPMDPVAAIPLWLEPLTATLVHANFIHLLFNMIILVFCGRPVESVLGSPAMAILYLLGAYAAAGGQYLVDPQAIAPMIGASGAISAVIGAYAMLFGRNKVKVASPSLALWLNALWLMAAWVLLNIFVGIALKGSTFVTGGEGVQVAVAAHIGGFIIGVLLANPLLLFKYRKA